MDRGSVGLQERTNVASSTMGDRVSSEVQRNTEVDNGHILWESRSKRCFIQENSRQMSRQSSVESYSSEQNRDTIRYRCL